MTVRTAPAGLSASEFERRSSNRTAVAELFTSRPNQWIATAELERVGGRQAWRTRVSECRRQLAMQIDNRQTRIIGTDGVSVVRVESEYRFVPHVSLGRDAGAYVSQAGLF